MHIFCKQSALVSCFWLPWCSYGPNVWLENDFGNCCCQQSWYCATWPAAIHWYVLCPDPITGFGAAFWLYSRLPRDQMLRGSLSSLYRIWLLIPLVRLSTVHLPLVWLVLCMLSMSGTKHLHFKVRLCCDYINRKMVHLIYLLPQQLISDFSIRWLMAVPDLSCQLHQFLSSFACLSDRVFSCFQLCPLVTHWGGAQSLQAAGAKPGQVVRWTQTFFLCRAWLNQVILEL